MKLTIGVLGDPAAAFAEETLTRLVELGRAIAEHDCVLIAEAQPRATNPVTLGARAAGGMVVGISLARAAADDLDVLICADPGPTACEAEIIGASDIVVIATGCSGPTDHLAACYRAKRPIGVLTRTKGIADAVEGLVSVCADRPYVAVFCDDDPARLVDRLINNYRAADGTEGAWARRPTEPRTAFGSVGE